MAHKIGASPCARHLTARAEWDLWAGYGGTSERVRSGKPPRAAARTPARRDAHYVGRGDVVGVEYADGVGDEVAARVFAVTGPVGDGAAGVAVVVAEAAGYRAIYDR